MTRKPLLFPKKNTFLNFIIYNTMPRHGISSDGHKLQCAGHSGQDLMALALTAGVKGHMGAGLKKRTPLSAGSLAQSGRLLLNINTQARSSFGRCSREFGGKPSTAFTGPFRLSLAAPKLQLAPASSSSLSLSLGLSLVFLGLGRSVATSGLAGRCLESF